MSKFVPFPSLSSFTKINMDIIRCALFSEIFIAVMIFGSHRVFCFHSDSNWISFPLAEGLLIVYHLAGVIRNEILRQSSLLSVSTFWSIFVALSSASKTISTQSSHRYLEMKSLSFR